MDAKIQEMERQAIANNDEMLAYRVVIERERSFRERGKQGYQLNYVIDGNDRITFLYNSDCEIAVELNTAERGPIIKFQRINSKWIVVDCNHPFPYYPLWPYSNMEEASAYALDKLLKFEKEKKFIELRVRQYNSQMLIDIEEEKSALSKLQILREKIGRDYLELLVMKDKLNALGGD